MTSGATLDLGGFTQAVNSLAGAGTVTNNGVSPAVLIAGFSAFSFASSTFSGDIQDGNQPLSLRGRNLRRADADRQ